MARKPDQPCAGCGKLLWGGTTSLPAGERMCRDCRRQRRLTTPKWPLRLCERDGCDRQFSGPISQRTCSLSCGQYLRFTEGPPARSGRTYRQCEICGRDYVPTHTQQRTCGRACGTALREKEYRERCPEKFPATLVWIRPCVPCGKLYVARRDKSVTCGQECWREHYKTLQRQLRADRRRRVVLRWCGGCNATFSCAAADTQRRYCTPECAKRTARRGRGNYRERARRFGVPYEPINKRVVFERDKWRCGICRRKVNPHLKYPNPMSASLDHIIPFACKGGHLYANVQLAHLQCNVDKGAGSAGEQLALVG